MAERTPSELCNAITRGDDAGAEVQLLGELRRREWFNLLRYGAGDDAEDLLHDVWLEMVKRIRGNEIRDPEEIFAFAHTLVVRFCGRERRRANRFRQTESLAA